MRLIYEEAIKELEYCVEENQGFNECRYTSKEIYRIAIECIEKQIPKKPKLYEDKFYGCKCGNLLASKSGVPGLSYCLNCGQAIDWKEVE